MSPSGAAVWGPAAEAELSARWNSCRETPPSPSLSKTCQRRWSCAPVSVGSSCPKSCLKSGHCTSGRPDARASKRSSTVRFSRDSAAATRPQTSLTQLLWAATDGRACPMAVFSSATLMRPSLFASIRLTRTFRSCEESTSRATRARASSSSAGERQPSAPVFTEWKAFSNPPMSATARSRRPRRQA